jgi:hypothetical protein
MRNVIILGSGRSGTSMVAGCLARARYFMGDQPYSPNDSNPKGYFEDYAINALNEDILAPAVRSSRVLPDFIPAPIRKRIRARLTPDRPMDGQRWLARLPLDIEIASTPQINARIAALVERAPFCFKDPRFSYTLPVWRDQLQKANAVYVCVFRDPASTAKSILKEIAAKRYLRTIKLNFDQALEVWTKMYAHILYKHYKPQDEWLFLHYNQVVESQGEGLSALEAFTGAPVDRSFPDPSLRRSVSDQPLPPEASSLYAELCLLANYDENAVPEKELITSTP